MTIISGGDLDKLRYDKQNGELFLTIPSYPILWQGRVNGSFSRGDRSINVDGGSGSISFFDENMEVQVGTSLDQWDVGIARLLDYSGTVSSGTFTLDQNGIVWQDDLYIRVLLKVPTIAIHSRITPAEVWTVGMETYSDSNTKPHPVCIAGSHQLKYMDGATHSFDFDLSNSYAMATGASIVSYGLTVYPSTGATVTINTSSGIGDIEVNQAGEWWAIATCTDSNGKTQKRYVYLASYDDDNKPYQDFDMGRCTITNGSGGKASCKLTGDINFDTIKDGVMAILWFRSYYGDDEDYINTLDYGNNILLSGYIKREKLDQNFDSGDYTLDISLNTIDETLKKTPMRGIPLEMKPTPTAWWHYGTDLTTGKAIHHLVKYHSTLTETHDIEGLNDNSQLRKAATFQEGNIWAMINDIGYNKGILSKMVVDKVGRLHFYRDAQLLNTAGRAALDTVWTLIERDSSDNVGINRNIDNSSFTLLIGGVVIYSYSSNDVFRSLIPGYREDSFSYGLPDRSGGSAININYQLMLDQEDSNEKAGRLYAQANLKYTNISIDFPGIYFGALTVLSNNGFYKLGFAESSLERYEELIDANLICRSISVGFRNGTFTVSGVFEPEAFGPNGVQNNYPSSMPVPPPPSEPRWEIDEIDYVPALLRFGSQNYREDTDIDWTNNSDNSGGPSFVTGHFDPYWKLITGSNNPKNVIPYGGGLALIARKFGINSSDWDYITPFTDPPNSWDDVVAPTVLDLVFNRIWLDPWFAGTIYTTCYTYQTGLYDDGYRAWLCYSVDYGLNWYYVDLFESGLYGAPNELYPIGLAVTKTDLYISVWINDLGDEKLQLLKISKSDFTISDTFDFGDCTFSELSANTNYLFPVTVLDDNDVVYVAGKFESQSGLYGPISHVDVSTDGGNTWSIVEDGWDADYCSNLYVSNLHDVNRNLYAVRETTVIPPPTPPTSSTWSTPTNGIGGDNFTSDDTYVYAGDLNFGFSYVRSFNPVTDTLNNIMSPGDIPIDYSPSAGVVIFEDELYIATVDDSAWTNFKVYKYDGTGTNWTEVLSVAVPASSSSAGQTCRLLVDDGYLIFVSGTSAVLASNSASVVRYFDGSSWSTGSFYDGTGGGFTPSGASPYVTGGSSLMYIKPQSTKSAHDTEESNLGLASIFRYNDGTTKEVYGYWDGDNGRFVITDDTIVDSDDNLQGGINLVWRFDNANTRWDYQDSIPSNLESGWTNPSSTVRTIQAVNLSWTCGYSTDVSNNLKLHFWDENTNAWSAGETIATGASYTSIRSVHKTSTGKVVAQIYTGSTYSSRVRDTDL